MQNAKKRVAKKRLTGRGDYSVEILSEKIPLTRLERKIDHLESRLVGGQLTKRGVAEKLGRTLGNFVNQGDLGALAGSQLAKYFGHGDYTVKSNSLMSAATETGAKFSRQGSRGTRIMEREYLGDIKSGSVSSGASLFSSASYLLNPTDPSTFPWLSRIASLYDQWEPNGIVFEFVSTSSDFNGASQALGTVIIATDYDAYDNHYTSKQEMENSDYACSTKPSCSLVHGIECSPKERPTPILYTATDNGAPLNSSLLGTTQIATQGCSVAGVTLGELWISYDITFYKKQLVPPTVPFWNNTGSVPVDGPYFTSTGALTSSQFTIAQNVGVSSVIQFNNKTIGSTFLVTYRMSAATLADYNAWVTTLTGTDCTILARAAYTTGLVAVLHVTSTGINSTVTILKNVLDASTEYQMIITQIDPHVTIW